MPPGDETRASGRCPRSMCRERGGMGLRNLGNRGSARNTEPHFPSLKLIPPVQMRRPFFFLPNIFLSCTSRDILNYFKIGILPILNYFKIGILPTSGRIASLAIAAARVFLRRRRRKTIAVIAKIKATSTRGQKLKMKSGEKQFIKT